MFLKGMRVFAWDFTCNNAGHYLEIGIKNQSNINGRP